MATKKQKRLEMQQRRAEYEAEIRASGLAAQERDRKRRLAKQQRSQEDAERENKRHQRILASARMRGELPEESA